MVMIVNNDINKKILFFLLAHIAFHILKIEYLYRLNNIRQFKTNDYKIFTINVTHSRDII